MRTFTSATVVSLSLIIFVLIGCQEASPSVDIEAEVLKIEELSQRWAAAESAKDLEGSIALLWDDAIMLPPNSDVVHGKESIRELYEALFELPFTSLTAEQTQITVGASGDIAWNWGLFTLTFEGEDGPITDVSKFLTTWEKRNGEWRVTANMFSTNTPLPTE